MPIKLASVLEKVRTIPNIKNRTILEEFNDYMREAGASESHQRNELLTLYYYAIHLGEISLLDINKRQQITAFLDSKRKPKEIDPDERWITTWNDYLGTLKHFFRWRDNQRGKDDLVSPIDWESADYIRIKKKRTKRSSILRY